MVVSIRYLPSNANRYRDQRNGTTPPHHLNVRLHELQSIPVLLALRSNPSKCRSIVLCSTCLPCLINILANIFVVLPTAGVFLCLN